MTLPSSIFVAGHRGMVGSAVIRRLDSTDCHVITQSRHELDLCDSDATDAFFQSARPSAVVMSAARVGGIAANQSAPVQFLSDNMQMTINVLQSAYRAGVARLLMLGSTCIYPRDCRQPMRETDLLSGSLEPTNEAYSLAKIAAVKLCQFYRRQYGVTYHSVMPTNLYGPGDNYDLEMGHVVAALLRRFHDAKEAASEEVIIWGTGKPTRDFMHVDDLADAIFHLLQIEDPPDWVNAGTGQEVSIGLLAETIARTVGFQGSIRNDVSRPDGTPRKCTDVTRLNQLGWKHSIELEQGLALAYESFLSEQKSGRLRGE